MTGQTRDLELYGSLRSPYVRKVRCVAHELGLADRIILCPIVNTPQASDPLLEPLSPVGKIPALQLPGGEVIIDSLLICERLDALAARPRMMGTDGLKAANLYLHTVGDGMIDAAFRWLAESWRPGDAMTPTIQALMETKLERCLTWLNSQNLRVEEPMLGELTAAAALAYLNFRCDWINWRTRHAALADWYAAISARPSLMATPFDGEGIPVSTKS